MGTIPNMAVAHTLYREQVVPTNLAPPGALSVVRKTSTESPRRILTSNRTPPETMYDGLVIEYRIVIPLLGKQAWLTEIKHIREHTLRR